MSSLLIPFAFCSYTGRALKASFIMSSFLASNCSSAMHSSKNSEYKTPDNPGSHHI